MAIAPTATSALKAGVTPGIDFPKKYITTKVDKDITETQLLPELQMLRANYKLVWDIPNERLLELAAVRQIFIDQGQSVSLFHATDERKSAIYHFKHMLYAMSLGLKGLYYSTLGDVDECVSCSS